jgi:hypothetical protein
MSSSYTVRQVVTRDSSETSNRRFSLVSWVPNPGWNFRMRRAVFSEREISSPQLTRQQHIFLTPVYTSIGAGEYQEGVEGVR